MNRTANWIQTRLDMLSPRTKRTLFIAWVLGAIITLLWISDANDHDYRICDDDHSPDGYCAQVERTP